MRLDHLLSKECCRFVLNRPLPRLNTGYSAQRLSTDGCRTASPSLRGSEQTPLRGVSRRGVRLVPDRGTICVGLPLFRFEGATPRGPAPSAMPQRGALRRLAAARPVRDPRSTASPWGVARSRADASLENSRASTSIFVLQARKSQRWMPWRLKPKKDVGDCDMPRGAVYRASIRGCPNGATRHPSWGVTPA